MNTLNEFYLTLFSNNSTEIFNQNTQSSFENKLPSHIDFKNESWKVGLSEIYLNDFLQTDKYIKDQCCTIFIGLHEVYVKNPQDPKTKIAVNKYIGHTFFPIEKSHLQLDDWKLNFLPTIIKNISPAPGFSRQLVLQELFTEILAFFSEAKNYDVKIPKQLTAEEKKNAIRITRTFNEEDFFIKTNHDYTVVTLLTELFEQKKNIKAFKNKLPELFKQTIQFYKDELNAMVMVYSDIIEPSVYGSSKVRALRSIYVDNCRNSYHKEFENIHYIPITKHIFETIAIKICDQYGENINFVANYIPTSIVLHFKKYYK